MSDQVLNLEGISKAYNIGKPNEVTVLQSCSLQISSGQWSHL